MDWTAFLHESLTGSLGIVKQLAIVIFPLFVGIEIIDKLGILDKISDLFQVVLKYIFLPREASFPIIISQLFGLVFGAGIIINKTDKLNPAELMSISIFFAMSHAILEDTFLFAAIGGNGFIIILTRLLMAFLMTHLITRFDRARSGLSGNQLN